MRPSEVREKLLSAGYESRREEEIALAGALRPSGDGARAILLEGPPGCGKTSLGEAWASATAAPLVYALLHSWSGDEELFCGVDVAAAVAGDAAHVRQDGVLARAARLSHDHDSVVVVLDEVDKTPERTEALLLDWLQSGRVPVRPGEHLTTRLDRVVVLLTSNGQGELGDALLRRCRRVGVRPLPVDTTVRLIASRAGVPAGVARLAWKAAREVAGRETVLSLQEGERLAGELWAVAESAADVRLSLAGWAARDEDGRRRAERADVSALWGEIRAQRRKS